MSPRILSPSRHHAHPHLHIAAHTLTEPPDPLLPDGKLSQLLGRCRVHCHHPPRHLSPCPRPNADCHHHTPTPIRTCIRICSHTYAYTLALALIGPPSLHVHSHLWTPATWPRHQLPSLYTHTHTCTCMLSLSHSPSQNPPACTLALADPLQFGFDANCRCTCKHT